MARSTAPSATKGSSSTTLASSPMARCTILAAIPTTLCALPSWRPMRDATNATARRQKKLQ